MRWVTGLTCSSFSSSYICSVFTCTENLPFRIKYMKLYGLSFFLFPSSSSYQNWLGLIVGSSSCWRKILSGVVKMLSSLTTSCATDLLYWRFSYSLSRALLKFLGAALSFRRYKALKSRAARYFYWLSLCRSPWLPCACRGEKVVSWRLSAHSEGSLLCGSSRCTGWSAPSGLEIDSDWSSQCSWSSAYRKDPLFACSSPLRSWSCNRWLRHLSECISSLLWKLRSTRVSQHGARGHRYPKCSKQCRDKQNIFAGRRRHPPNGLSRLCLSPDT